MSQGGPVWSSHVMHGRYPLPLRELCQRARVEIGMEISETGANLVGWRVGNQKRARPWWSCTFGQAQSCLKELRCFVRPVLPPLGAAGLSGRYAAVPPAEAAGGALGPDLGSGPTRTPCAPN